MKFNTKHIIPVLLASSLIFSISCAEKITEDYTEVEINSLKLWMSNNHPDYTELHPGLFAKVIPTADSKVGRKPSDIDDWLFLNYVGRDLQGNYFANTYKKTAQHLGTFQYSTHFTPLLYKYFVNGISITSGVHEALKTVNVGDSVDMFMTSRWAFGETGSGSTGPYSGYGGNFGIMAQRPARFSMKLSKMTTEPLDMEIDSVIQYVKRNLKLQATDSIKKGFYYKIITARPNADTIRLDSTVRLKYTGYFLDKFVFDTNVKAVAIANNITKVVTNPTTGLVDGTADPYAPIDFNYSSSSFVEGFTETVKKMRLGESAIAVFTSRYGYGITGNTGGKTIIQPYESLVFEIKVLAPNEKE